jgi:hypothetical protein
MKVHAPGAKFALAAGPVSLVVGVPFTNAASTRIPARWKNCTVVNKRYPHGVGKVGAHDRTSGEPVTNFTHSNYLYRLAMRYNRGLDRDKDGIACEKLAKVTRAAAPAGAACVDRRPRRNGADGASQHSPHGNAKRLAESSIRGTLS